MAIRISGDGGQIAASRGIPARQVSDHVTMCCITESYSRSVLATLCDVTSVIVTLQTHCDVTYLRT